jgi:hypothetical protein
MQEFTESVIQNGFSIIVSAFLLLRMERELRALREAIERLRYCQVCRFAPLEVRPFGVVPGVAESSGQRVADGVFKDGVFQE